MPAEYRITGSVRVRVVALVANRPDGIGMDELVSLVYAEHPNGEPDYAANSIKTTIHNANKQLLPQGYVIRSTMGPGARYRLLPAKHHLPDKHYHGTAGMLATF
jgi:hypothetical protein